MAVPDSMRKQISAALLGRLNIITELNYKAFDVIKMTANDFQDFELPAVQIIDLGSVDEHEQRRSKVMWNLAVEVVIGPKTDYTPTQTELWNLMEYIENTLFAVPNLGIAGVVSMFLIGSSTDLHLMAPMYVGRIELAVQFYQQLVGACT